MSQANAAVVEIRAARKQINELTARLAETQAGEKSKMVRDKAKAVSDRLTAIEEALYQTKNRASEDPLNFPVRLNNKLAALLSAIASADAPPTSAEQQVFEDEATGVNEQVSKLKQVMETEIPALNKLARDQDIPAIAVKAADTP